VISHNAPRPRQGTPVDRGGAGRAARLFEAAPTQGGIRIVEQVRQPERLPACGIRPWRSCIVNAQSRVLEHALVHRGGPYRVYGAPEFSSGRDQQQRVAFT